jgi:hypothetical protein
MSAIILNFGALSVDIFWISKIDIVLLLIRSDVLKRNSYNDINVFNPTPDPLRIFFT